jgi:hypothetical protein
MIKVDLVEQEDGNRRIFFECQTREEIDTLDKLLEALVGPFPRRGAYATSTLLVVDVNVSNS